MNSTCSCGHCSRSSRSTGGQREPCSLAGGLPTARSLQRALYVVDTRKEVSFNFAIQLLENPWRSCCRGLNCDVAEAVTVG